MGVINIVEKIKKIHQKDIVLIEIGTFYYIYGKDSYIISYLFGYNLKKIENTYSSAFPKNSLNRIIANLENKKINYIIVDRRNNYEVISGYDNKNLNRYEEFYQKAKEYICVKKRINNINEYLNRNIKQQKIKELLYKIEKVINEAREI